MAAHPPDLFSLPVFSAWCRQVSRRCRAGCCRRYYGFCSRWRPAVPAKTGGDRRGADRTVAAEVKPPRCAGEEEPAEHRDQRHKIAEIDVALAVDDRAGLATTLPLTVLVRRRRGALAKAIITASSQVHESISFQPPVTEIQA